MFQIIDTKNSTYITVKSNFLTAGQALRWAKKNLEPGSCPPWGDLGHSRYFIKKQ